MIKNILKKFAPSFLFSWYHFILALLGAYFYGFPSRKMKVIGVTGTQGKSTVVDFTTRILEEAGYGVASLSSIKFKIGAKEWVNALKMTMPGRFGIQKFLKKALQAGCEYAVLEVTSEGILQHRHRFIDFDVAVFTNLSPEHIERHGGFENYRGSKGKFFEKVTKMHILNLDDKNINYFLQFPSKKIIGYRLKKERVKKDDDCGDQTLIIEAKNVKVSVTGISFVINNLDFNLKLLGEFNVYNSLAAICAALLQGVNLKVCKKALEKIENISGRMEIIAKEPFYVIVDYAHTPDGLCKVYKTVRNLADIQNSKLICVLGAAGGGRDKWKRPKMGEIAKKYCDKVILTDEDPYDENPSKILEDIEKGFLKTANFKARASVYEKILDRKKAIQKAISMAEINDVVIITGKGCEPWMCVAEGKKIPWDDREIVRKELSGAEPCQG